LYSMKPNLRNLFMKKLTRDRVVPIDLLPNLPSFIRRVCSGYALVWGVLRTQSV
jgi:hypothetical protein